jgi:hypothetical protein
MLDCRNANIHCEHQPLNPDTRFFYDIFSVSLFLIHPPSVISTQRSPTRARYFDHVSKARIMDVVANAVSPKAAADLKAMKKADAAAAAELRLAKVSWLPEVLTHRELPIVNHFDPDRDDDAGELGSDN